MAKLYLDRLRKKYGAKGWTGKRYRELMALIIASNHENVDHAVSLRSDAYYRDQFRRLQKTTAVQLKVPPMEQLLPRRNVYLRKGATNGRMITDSLRDRLSYDLRQAVASFMESGRGTMQYQKGEAIGRINPALIAQFESAIMKTFDNYTKSHGGEIPSNISTIAETEIRSAISDIKHTYAQQLMARNPGRLIIVKKWKHNHKLSSEPRIGHEMMDGKTARMDVPFTVPMYRRLKTGKVYEGQTLMQHPHDPSAPPEQVINCHCECDYLTEIVPAKRPLASGKAGA